MGAVLALRGWRLGGAIASLVVLAAIVGGLVWLLRDRDRLLGVERRALACEAAVTNGSDAATNCPQVIAQAATRAQRYLACDAALSEGDIRRGKAGDLYAVRAACSEHVKRRDAEATALAADNADLARQLSDARGQLAGALTRADARHQTLTRKDRDAAAAIAGLPRAVDGRIRCDDRCLRQLVGE
jgi:hypothetical protein